MIIFCDPPKLVGGRGTSAFKEPVLKAAYIDLSVLQNMDKDLGKRGIHDHEDGEKMFT